MNIGYRSTGSLQPGSKWLWLALWRGLHLGFCALLVLLEPLLRATLVPLAFLSFMVTLVFGFVVGDPKFPRWAMLGFSVGCLILYWLYLGLLMWFVRAPASR
jgi:hypothetical protein